MDQGTWEGIGTLLAMLAFIAVTVWAYSGRNKSRFDEAAMLPFADDLPAAEPQAQVDAMAAKNDEPAPQRAEQEIGDGQ